tara:strand:+ start:46 stop:354 length:309 start_codon:yes stop_codon:yes gene_type:complete
MREFYNSDGSKPKAIGKIPIRNIQDIEFNRFNCGCENCGQKDYFLLHKKKVLNNSVIEKFQIIGTIFRMLSSDKRYYLSCPHCQYVLELDYKEYVNVKEHLF